MAALPKGSAATLKRMADELRLNEIVRISTCNRTEIYWTVDREIRPEEVFGAMPHLSAVGADEICSRLYFKTGIDVAEHLFQVTCGMDSLVAGETQILKQVKRAYERGRENGLTKTSLNLLFQKAFRVAKKVHAQTSLSSHRASIPSVALKFTEAIFDDLANASILVIGTGEIARITLEALDKRGARNISFVTRTEDRAKVRYQRRTWSYRVP